MTAIVILITLTIALIVTDIEIWKLIVRLVNRRVRRLSEQKGRPRFENDWLLRSYLTGGLIITVGLFSVLGQVLQRLPE
ncbi:MAG: hypothetical protein JW828_12125 [Sedimentisphaerales bacterium]|nr:hypothetical protein [Sedimentisphaerales bacterium]